MKSLFIWSFNSIKIRWNFLLSALELLLPPKSAIQVCYYYFIFLNNAFRLRSYRRSMPRLAILQGWFFYSSLYKIKYKIYTPPWFQTDNQCTAGYESGLCSGDNNRKCCKNCDTTCQWQESQDAKGDSKCEDAGGKCQHNTNYCSGSYQGSMCGGSSSRQCCGASGGGGGGDCNLVRYTNTHIKGYNGLRVEVDAGFKSEMDKMNRFAIDCSVTVQVTHAFRKEGQNIGGTIVPPASNSNHLVGHAIDFNLETPNGWCNGDCLDWENNSYGKVSI